MHTIVTEDADVQAALQNLAEAHQARTAYAEKVARAREEYEREQQAALDRGEVHSPRLEVIEDTAVTAHLNQREAQALRQLEVDIARAAGRLVPQLEGREQVLLASVPKLKVAELDRVAAEIGELATAKNYLQGIRGLVRLHPMPSPDVAGAVTVTATQVLDAALSGGSVIGRTPPSPEPARVVAFDSPEGEALMGSNGGTNARRFR